MSVIRDGDPLSQIFSRRSFLRTSASVTIIVAGGGVWRAYDQGMFSTGKGPAYQAWKDWHAGDQSGLLSLVGAAVLAASSYNTQPWLFQISDSAIDVFVDLQRNLKTIDSYLRAMYISVGCALENLLIAAKAHGYQYQITWFPHSSDTSYVAHIALAPGKKFVSDLYKAIGHRHTNRGPYDKERLLPSDLLEVTQRLRTDIPETRVFWFATEEIRGRIADLILQAMESILADSQQARDSSRWIRYSWQEVQKYRDGISFDALGFSSFQSSLLKIFSSINQELISEKRLQAMRDIQIATAPAFGIIAVRDRFDRRQQIAAGRLWERIHLWGTTRGLGLQAFDQISQCADREINLGIEPKFASAMNGLLGENDWQVALPFRIGYPQSEALASPRRTAQEVIVSPKR